MDTSFFVQNIILYFIVQIDYYVSNDFTITFTATKIRANIYISDFLFRFIYPISLYYW